MGDGVSVETAGEAVVLRLYELAPTILADTSGVLVTFGHPGAERADDCVFFGGWSISQEPGPLSRSNRAREEQVEFDVVFSSYRGGGWEAELEASNAANGLLKKFEYYVRQTNTELATSVGAGDGVARYCFLLRASAQPFTVLDERQVAVGRNVTVNATFGAVVRVEGIAA